MTLIRQLFTSILTLATATLLAAATPVSEIAIRYLPVGAMLTWRCAEGDVVSFAVERSLDGFNFERLAVVEGEATAEGFQYLDTRRPTARHYYRVTAVDAEGTSYPSAVAEARPAGTVSWSLAGTSSVDVGAFLEFEVESDDVTMLACELYDFLGASVGRYELLVTPGPNQLSVKTADLAPGAYRLEVTGAEESASIQFLKVAQEEEYDALARGR